MSRRKITAGITSVAVPIRVDDTSSTTGAGLGALAFNTSGLVAEYRRQGQSSWTSITLSAGTLGTWSSGGFIADGSLGGAYEFGVPDAALSSGRWSIVRLYGATNMAPVLLEFELDAVNYQDAVRFGLSALPNAAAAASGGLPTVGATIPNATAGASGGLFIAGTNAATTVTTAFTTTFTGNVTGNLSGSVGSVTGAVGSVTGAVGSVTGAVGSVAGNVGGNVVGTVASVVGAVGSVAATVPANVTQWLGTAAATPNTAGIPKVDLSLYAGSTVTVIDGTAQAGSTTTITLTSGSSATDNFYRGYKVTAQGGAGAGQYAFVASYVGSTRVATLDRTLGTAFDGTTTYVLDAPVAADVVQWLGSTPSALSSGLVQATATVSLGTNAPAGWINAAAFGTGAIDANAFAQAAADRAWSTTTRVLTAGTNIVLAKGTGVTGFNDIAATAIVSAGAITTSAGKVSGVILADTVTTYTGNTPQTGDAFARIGAAGAGLTGITGVSLASSQTTSITGNITGNLSGTVGSVAGAVGSVTGNVGGNVTGSVGSLATQAKTDAENAVWNGLHSAHTTAGTFGLYLDAAISGVTTGGTSAGAIATAVWQDLLSGSDFTTAGSAGKLIKDNLGVPVTLADGSITTAKFAAGATIPRVTLADTVTTYTGNTPQTGDLYAKVNPLIASGAFTTPALANAPAGSGGSVTVAGYATGQDPATLTWAANTRTLTDKAGFALSSTGLNAVAGFNGWSFPQMLRALVAFVVGRRTGVPASGSGGTVTFTNASAGDYGTVTVDTAGNITANGMTPTP